jgi:phosphate-selective porin OprO/OprP
MSTLMNPTRIALAGLGLATLASATPPADPGKESTWLDLDGVRYESLLEPDAEESTSPLKSLKTVYANDDITVSWGGRIMIDWGWFDKDDNYPVSSEDGTEIRRARFFSKGTLYGTVDWKLQLDFAGGDADFADAYMRWQSGWGDVLVGHFKEPMGLEELTSSRFITFMERSMMTEAMIPGRNSGFMLTDTIGEATNWGLFFGRETDDFGNDTGDGEYVYTGRLAHWFAMGDQGDGIHVGAGASWRNSQDDKRTRTRPEAHLLNRIIDSGANTSTDGALYYNLSTAWVRGPLSLQGEYTGGQVKDWSASASGDDVDIMGYYVQASYFLTGERRPHKANRGNFDRVKPIENWDGKSLKGAWELALRYSAVNFDDGNFVNSTTGNQGAKSGAITLGLNYYLNPNARIMFNVVRNNYEDDIIDDEDMTAAMMRFQVDW